MLDPVLIALLVEALKRLAEMYLELKDDERYMPCVAVRPCKKPECKICQPWERGK